MATNRKRQEMDFTKEDVDNITTACKDPKFRQLLQDYATEVTDPKNVAQYEKEMTQLEKQRGVDITFLHPKPGYVLKTSVNGDKKAFINISSNENIDKPSCQRDCTKGLYWLLPYSLAPGRDDWDKEKRRCIVYDVLFHPDALYMGLRNKRFKKLVEETAMDGVERSFGVGLDRKNLRYPRIKFKGYPVATVIRRRSGEGVVEELDERFPPQAKDDVIHGKDEKIFKAPEEENIKYADKEEKKFTEPKYTIKYRNQVDMLDFALQPEGEIKTADNWPTHLMIEIDLPLIPSASCVDLDVAENSLKLSSETPAVYLLQLKLTYPVDSDEAVAQFDTTSRKLKVTLPIKKEKKPVAPDKCEAIESPPVQINEEDNQPPPNVNEKISKESTNVELDERTKELSNETQIYTPVEPEIRYLAPKYTIRQTEHKIILLLNVFNVDPELVQKNLEIGESDEDPCSVVTVRLTSLGSGFVPCYYALIVKSPLGKKFECVDVDVEVNNVLIKVEKSDDCYGDWNSVLIGSNDEHLEDVSLVTMAKLADRLEKLQAELEDESKLEEDTPKLDVVKMNEDMLELVLNQKKSNCDAKKEGLHFNLPRSKVRSLSESSADMSPSHKPRSILKNKRSGRSLSESSEDAGWIAGDEPLSPGSTGEDIPEESSADEDSATKKSVRFNEIVSRKLFRSNSSILGQKKKNQRKQKLKKRASQRRTSESEGSETDTSSEGHKVKPKTEPAENIKEQTEKEKQKADHDHGDVDTTDPIEKSEHKENELEKCSLKTGSPEKVQEMEVKEKNRFSLKNTAIYDLD